MKKEAGLDPAGVLGIIMREVGQDDYNKKMEIFVNKITS